MLLRSSHKLFIPPLGDGTKSRRGDSMVSDEDFEDDDKVKDDDDDEEEDDDDDKDEEDKDI